MAERSASVEFLVLCPTNKLHPRACHLSEASLRAKSKDIARLPFVAIFPGQTSAAAKMAAARFFASAQNDCLDV